MYCQLGDIVFDGLKGIESWSVEGNDASYGEHALIDGKPRLQKTGDALEELSLSFRLHARFCNPQEELAKLNKAKTDGEILPLLMGDGRYISDYVVISAPYTVDHALSDGTIVQATVALSLKEFVPYSKDEQQQQAARKNGFATGDKKPVVKHALQPPTDAANAAKKVTDTTGQTDRVDDLAGDYVNNPSARHSIGEAINEACDKGTAAIDGLNDLLNNAASLQDKYTGLQAVAGTVKDRLSAVKALFPITNISDLQDANTALQAAARDLRTGATPLFNSVITRRG